jgi:hypothetical protein
MSAWFCAPLFAQPLALGRADWDQHLFYRASVLKSAVEYGQLPFWNPWYCGGNVLWQNPQVPLLDPTYLLTALVPLALAMKISVVLHYWLGLAGMHVLLTRGIGLQNLPLVVFLSSTFALQGALALHVASGHATFLPGFYLPALLFLFLRALETGAARDALLGGTVFALLVHAGGAHVVPMALLAVGSVGLLAAVFRRRVSPLVVAVALVCAGAAYAAPKLVPVTAFVADRLSDRRPDRPHNEVTAEIFARAYVDPSQRMGDEFANQPYGWHEYGNYVGPLAVLFAVLSLIYSLILAAGPERWLGRALAVSTLVALSIAAGEFATISPAALLRRLPFFEHFRIPSRHTIVLVLLATTTMAWAARQLAGRFDATPARRWLTVLVCGLATLNLGIVNRGHFAGVFSQPAIDLRFSPLARPPAPVPDNRTSGRNRGSSPMLRSLASGTGLLRCYEPLQLPQVAHPRRPIVYTNVPDRPAEVAAFSPNRVEFAVPAGTAPVRIFMNQNHARGWTSTLGPVRLDRAERKPAVTVPAGSGGLFAFEFVPRGLWQGVLVFVLALLATPLFWRRRLPDGAREPGSP